MTKDQKIIRAGFAADAEFARGGARQVRYSYCSAGRGAAAAYGVATVGDVQARVKRPAVFFDRDGVLNVDCGYIGSADRFIWVAGAREAVQVANARGYLVFVVTNQSGVARGLFDEASVRALHDHMQAELNAFGGHVDEFCYCPHLPDAARSDMRWIANAESRSPA